VEKVDWGAYSSFHLWRGKLPGLEHAARLVSLLGWYPVLGGVLLIAVAWLIATRRVRSGLFLAVLVAGSALLVELLKLVVARPRPPDWNMRLGTPLSFPSAHAFVSVVLYGALAWLGTRSLAGWRTRLPVYAVTVFLVLVIGASQLFLGSHFLSDVLAGWAGGMSLLLAASNVPVASTG